MKRNKRTWIFEITPKDKKTEKYMVIDSLNELGERKWIKFWPINPSEVSTVAVILDKPDEVQWKFKESHIEEVDPVTGQKTYYSIATAGSVSVQAGISIFSKETDSKVFVFPVEPLESNEVNKIKPVDNLGTTNIFSVEVEKPTWLGYVSTGSVIKKITKNKPI